MLFFFLSVSYFVCSCERAEMAASFMNVSLKLLVVVHQLETFTSSVRHHYYQSLKNFVIDDLSASRLALGWQNACLTHECVPANPLHRLVSIPLIYYLIECKVESRSNSATRLLNQRWWSSKWKLCHVRMLATQKPTLKCWAFSVDEIMSFFIGHIHTHITSTVRTISTLFAVLTRAN